MVLERAPRFKARRFSEGQFRRFFSDSPGIETGVIQIGPEQSFWRGWYQLKRIWSAIPDCSEIYGGLVERMCEELEGHSILIELDPEHVAFEWDEYVVTLKSLDDELARPHRIATKTAHATRRMYWGHEEIVPYQYIFDIRDVTSVRRYLQRFASFDMLKILILKPVSDAAEKAAGLLQKFFLDEIANLDPILECAAYLVYYDYNGIVFNIEAERTRLDTISGYILQLTGPQ